MITTDHVMDLTHILVDHEQDCERCQQHEPCAVQDRLQERVDTAITYVWPAPVVIKPPC